MHTAHDRLLCLAPHVLELITVVAITIATFIVIATANATDITMPIAIIAIALLTMPVMLASTDTNLHC